MKIKVGKHCMYYTNTKYKWKSFLHVRLGKEKFLMETSIQAKWIVNEVSNFFCFTFNLRKKILLNK